VADFNSKKRKMPHTTCCDAARCDGMRHVTFGETYFSELDCFAILLAGTCGVTVRPMFTMNFFFFAVASGFCVCRKCTGSAMVGPSPIENGVQEKSRGPSSNFFFPKKFDDLFFVALDFFPTWNLFSAPSLSLLVNSTR